MEFVPYAREIHPIAADILFQVFLSQAYRLPRAIESPPGDFTDNGNGIDPIIDLRKLSAYLLQRLPAVTADKIIISLAKDASDRSMDEQIQGFVCDNCRFSLRHTIHLMIMLCSFSARCHQFVGERRLGPSDSSQ